MKNRWNVAHKSAKANYISHVFHASENKWKIRKYKIESQIEVTKLNIVYQEYNFSHEKNHRKLTRK